MKRFKVPQTTCLHFDDPTVRYDLDTIYLARGLEDHIVTMVAPYGPHVWDIEDGDLTAGSMQRAIDQCTFRDSWLAISFRPRSYTAAAARHVAAFKDYRDYTVFLLTV